MHKPLSPRRTMQLLETLPRKVRHPAMIPFGTLAFFAGQLVHTNECMCKMGEMLSLSSFRLVARIQILEKQAN